MSKSAVIIGIFAFAAFAPTAHAAPVCGYGETCDTTTVVATDEPPVPSTVPSTIAVINAPATVPGRAVEPDDCMAGGTTRWSILPCGPTTTIAMFVCDGVLVADTCVPAAAVYVAPPLPATGAGSETVALIGLVAIAVGVVLMGVRWARKP